MPIYKLSRFILPGGTVCTPAPVSHTLLIIGDCSTAPK